MLQVTFAVAGFAGSGAGRPVAEFAGGARWERWIGARRGRGGFGAGRWFGFPG